MRRVAENLEWVIRYFAADPAGSMATLEEMYRSDRQELIAETLRVVGEPGDHPGLISLVSFLVKKQALLPLLVKPEIALASRVRLAKLAIRVDGDLDAALAEAILKDLRESASPAMRQELLEILSETRVRPEVIRRLAPVLRDPHPRLHSKMALLMARVEPEGEWVQEGLADGDARVRANVVEALWSQKSAFAREIFQRASEDVHHRVAANAILGLYLQGERSALPKIRRLLLESTGLDRRAGLWLLEKTRDPRYLPQLGKLIGKVEPEARTRCLRVIQAAKARKEQAIERGRLKVEWFATGPGRARLRVANGERPLTSLHPFEVVLHSGGQVLDEYELRVRPREESLQVVLLAAECSSWGAGWSQAWRDALPPPQPGQAGNDRFGVLHYRAAKEKAPASGPPKVAFRLLGLDLAAQQVSEAESEPDRREGEPEGTIVPCGLGASTLRRAFERVPAGPNGLNAAIRQAVAQASRTQAHLHLVVLDEAGDIESPSDEDLPLGGFSLDVLTTRENQRLSERCEERGGRLVVTTSVVAAARHLAALHRCWGAEYEVEFVGPAWVDSVEVWSESGYGSVQGEGSFGGMVGVQGLEPRASSV